jgi:hypothetical protein
MRTLFLILTMAAAMVAQNAAVTVTDGYVSRNPRVGGKVFVWAQQNTSTRVFAGWSGDTHLLLDPLAPQTTLVAPATAVSLRATYRTVPAWTAVSGMFNGIPVSYFVPPELCTGSAVPTHFLTQIGT